MRHKAIVWATPEAAGKSSRALRGECSGSHDHMLLQHASPAVVEVAGDDPAPQGLQSIPCRYVSNMNILSTDLTKVR